MSAKMAINRNQVKFLHSKITIGTLVMKYLVRNFCGEIFVDISKSFINNKNDFIII